MYATAILVIAPVLYVVGFVIAARRGWIAPQGVIGTREDPYILRWYVTPWKRLSNIPAAEMGPVLRFLARLVRRWPGIMLHCVLRDDDDRALHDHPWANASLLLSGEYAERVPNAFDLEETRLATDLQHAPASVARMAGRRFIPDIHIRRPGSLVFRRADLPHRLSVVRGPVWSLFFTGIKSREWGFHCPQGWRHWRIFTDPTTGGATVGRGCD